MAPPKFDPKKLKLLCKTAVVRLRIRRNKAANNAKNERREIAKLLSQGKDENARIKVEQVIKDENMADALEELEVHVEEIAARLPMVQSAKYLPEDLSETVHTVIYAAPRVNVKELLPIKQQLTIKYGKIVEQDALINRNNCVNTKIAQKLSPMPPDNVIIFGYLNNIASQYNIDWKAEDFVVADLDPSMGNEISTAVPQARSKAEDDDPTVEGEDERLGTSSFDEIHHQLALEQKSLEQETRREVSLSDDASSGEYRIPPPPHDYALPPSMPPPLNAPMPEQQHSCPSVPSDQELEAELRRLGSGMGNHSSSSSYHAQTSEPLITPVAPAQPALSASITSISDFEAAFAAIPHTSLLPPNTQANSRSDSPPSPPKGPDLRAQQESPKPVHQRWTPSVKEPIRSSEFNPVSGFEVKREYEHLFDAPSSSSSANPSSALNEDEFEEDPFEAISGGSNVAHTKKSQFQIPQTMVSGQLMPLHSARGNALTLNLTQKEQGNSARIASQCHTALQNDGYDAQYREQAEPVATQIQAKMVPPKSLNAFSADEFHSLKNGPVRNARVKTSPTVNHNEDGESDVDREEEDDERYQVPTRPVPRLPPDVRPELHNGDEDAPLPSIPQQQSQQPPQHAQLPPHQPYPIQQPHHQPSRDSSVSHGSSEENGGNGSVMVPRMSEEEWMKSFSSTETSGCNLLSAFPPLPRDSPESSCGNLPSLLGDPPSPFIPPADTPPPTANDWDDLTARLNALRK